jgi:phosphate acetyltransferase
MEKENDRMSGMDKLVAIAKGKKRRIALPESFDQRVLDAAKSSAEAGESNPVLLGVGQPVSALPAGCEWIDITAYPQGAAACQAYTEKRKAKGASDEDIQKELTNPLVYACALLHAGLVDGVVAGCATSTADVLRASIRGIGTAKGFKTVSSFFIMVLPRPDFGMDGILLYSDGGVVINPTAEQLAEIAISTADNGKSLLGMEPRVAMLSFSTKGSAKHPDVDKVIEATRIAKERRPDLMLDGELQGDAALVATVGQRKCPGSPVAGKANIMIFPDLDAGNICYKLTERLAGADAYGPILQGLAKPVNDLSRGCSAEDIRQMIVITSAQAAALE